MNMLNICQTMLGTGEIMVTKKRLSFHFQKAYNLVRDTGINKIINI